MDFVVDKVDYSVSEFFESFGHNLPEIVKVTQGFFGEIVDDTFDRDQIYRLHTTSRQKRVIAKASDRHYSIPLNYPLKVCVVKKHGKIGKEQTLKDIVTEHHFPVDVKFAKDQEFAVGSSTTTANRFPQLKLIDEFDEVYLLGNTIIDGVIDLRIVQIPLYLSLLRLAEVTGIKNQPEEKWRRYNNELNGLIENSVEFDLTYGNKDIAVYHQDSFKADTIYTYIEPRSYSNIYSVNQFQPTRGPSAALTSSSESHGNVYEEISRTHKPDVVKSLKEVGGDLKSFFDAKSRTSVAGRPVPSIPNSDKSDKHDDMGSQSPALPKRHPLKKPSHPPEVPPKPNVYANDIPRGTVMPTTQADLEKKQTPTMQRQQSNNKKIDMQPSPLDLKTQQNKLAKSQSAEAEPKKTDSRSSVRPSQTTNADEEPDKIKHFHVDELSMQELADCMKTLKLSKYISLFKENMVDGAILKELNVQLLKADFGLNGIEAIRLMKFAKDGHIPK